MAGAMTWGVASATAGARAALLRHSMTSARLVTTLLGAFTGLTFVAGTLAMVLTAAPPAVAGTAALCSAAWAIGWIVAPLLSSGTGLSPTMLAVLPLRASKQTFGLLVASCVGVAPAVLLFANLGLVVAALRMGLSSTLLAVPITLLQTVFIVLLSQVSGRLIARFGSSRVGWEISSLVVGVLVALLTMGWFAIGAILSLMSDVQSAAGTTLWQWLPTSWAVDLLLWIHTGHLGLAAAAGLALLAGVAALFVASTALLTSEIRAKSPSHAHRSRNARKPPRRGSPLAAVVWRELLQWTRDPRRGRFLRIAFWIAVAMAILPLADGVTVVAPFSGLIFVIFASAFTSNVVGLDGGSVALTLLTPGAEWVDIRGRQLAWLFVVAPVALILTVVPVVLTGATWAWPWVLAALPAAFGGGAAAVPLAGLILIAPVPDRPEGTPMDGLNDDNADIVRLQNLAVMASTVAHAAVPASLVLAGFLTQSDVLAASGIATGLILGAASAMLGGRLGSGLLHDQGPEITLRLRGSGSRTAPPTRAAAQPRSDALTGGKTALAGILITVAILLVLPQGGVALGLHFAHANVTGWLYALHLPPSTIVPACIANIAAGILASWGAVRLLHPA